MERAVITVVLFLFLLFSCTDKKDAANNCSCGLSCECSNKVIIKQEPAAVVYTLDGALILSPVQGIMMPCGDFTYDNSTDGLLVLVDGTLTPKCEKAGDPIPKKIIESHHIVKSTDSLFNAGPMKLTIIRSEDYGFDPGFGFKYGNLVQPTMPAIGGLRPFKTKVDAFKAGLLMMYKRELTPYDLVFLKVL